MVTAARDAHRAPQGGAQRRWLLVRRHSSGEASFACQQPRGNHAPPAYALQAAAPSLGIGRIKARDNPALYGTDRECSLRTPDDPFYKKYSAEASRQAGAAGAGGPSQRRCDEGAVAGCLSAWCAVQRGSTTLWLTCSRAATRGCPPGCRFQICIDVFAFGSAYMDLPSLGALPKYTGGQVGPRLQGRWQGGPTGESLASTSGAGKWGTWAACLAARSGVRALG